MLKFSSICLALFIVGDALEHHPKQLIFSPENQFGAGIPDFNFLTTRQAVGEPQYNFADPRYQPQFLFYGGGPGQPFLLNPAPAVSPNNFLYPQVPQPPGPNIIYRNNVPQQGRPNFFAPPGFSTQNPRPQQRPAFVPAVEKDAEEIPTNPARIPPFNPKKSISGKKPEKLETFNETPETEGVENVQPKIPSFNPNPGHRYFVLNGQPLFNYPYTASSFGQNININPDDVLKYSQNFPLTSPQEVPVPVIPVKPTNQFQHPNFLNPNFQNPANFDGLKRDNYPENAHNYLQNIPVFLQPNPYHNRFQTPQLVHHQTHPQFVHQQQGAQGQILRNSAKIAAATEKPKIAESKPNQAVPTTTFRTVLPLIVSQNEPNENVQIRVSTKDFNLQPVPIPNGIYNQQYTDIADDAVVIDARYEDSNKKETENKGEGEGEEVSTAAEQSQEPSLAQAGPSATALAGPGGVAAAGSRATAFAGKDGMAVSNPRATAIAGPAREETKEDEESKKDSSSKKEKKDKYLRQRFRILVE